MDNGRISLRKLSKRGEIPGHLYMRLTRSFRYKYLDELAVLSENELWRKKGIGPKSIERIKQLTEEYRFFLFPENARNDMEEKNDL